MEANNQYTALYDGELELIKGSPISCAVLNDSERTRVLSQNEMVKALGKSLGGSKRGEANLPRWISASNLTPYISSDLREAILNPIMYKTTSGNIAHGIDATLLADVCDVWLDAERAGVLHDSQHETAARAYILSKALKKVAIIALIDEASGYQFDKERAKDNLQKFLHKILQDEAVKWVKTFPDSFFEMIFAMKNWHWLDLNQKPGVVGKYINDLVYSRVAPGVLNELRVKNPKIDGKNRKKKHHQYLTPDFGSPLLKERLEALQALGRASGMNWDIFIQLVNKAYPKYGDTIELNFPETIEELQSNKPRKPLSDFDQKLMTALKFNHKEDKNQ